MNSPMEANVQDLRKRCLLRASGNNSYVNAALYQHFPHSSPPSYIHHNHPRDEFDNNNNNNNPLNHQSTRLGLGVGPEHLAFSMERLSLSSMSNILPNSSYDDRLRRCSNTNSAAGIRSLGSQQLYLPPQHYQFQGLTHFIENVTEGKQRIIEIILQEVKDDLHELMMDQHSIHFIETVFEASTESQKTTILDFLVRDKNKLTKVCTHEDGTQVFQRFLKLLKTPMQQSTAVFALKEITLTLAKNIHGGDVIQQCLKLSPPELSQIILDEVRKNCVEIARNKIGCSIFQRCLDQAKEDAFKRLIEEIVSNVLVLVDHRYGNYVVQYIIKMRIPQANATIISQLIGKYDRLSKNKHGSNVMEDLLEFSEESDAAKIVEELLCSPNFVAILQNRYGNYVARSALKNSKGNLNQMLSNSILFNYPRIYRHVYGKRVLAYLQRRKKIRV